MPTVINIDIIRGTEFNLTVALKDNSCLPVNLSGYSAEGKIKYRYSDPSGLCNISGVPLLGYEGSGYLKLSIPVTGTALLPVMQGLYDVRIYDTNGYYEQTLRGYANIYPEVMLP